MSRLVAVGDVGHLVLTLGVLGGDDDGVHADGDGASALHSVLASDLGLAVGSHPWADSVLADLGKAGAQGGSKLVGERHE